MVVGVGVCARAQVSLGAPGKRSRVPPREARLLARPPGVAEPPPSRSVWTPARPASVNGTFFSSSGCYLGGSGLGRGRVLCLVQDSFLGQGWVGALGTSWPHPDSPGTTGQGAEPALPTSSSSSSAPPPSLTGSGWGGAQLVQSWVWRERWVGLGGGRVSRLR